MIEKKRLSCDEAVEQLWAYIDGELPATDERAVHDHLEACRHCCPHHDFQKAFREFLGHKCRDRVPPELRRRIFMRLLAEEAGDRAGDPGESQA
jgi:mycothiol system anti-sigma-R factor